MLFECFSTYSFSLLPTIIISVSVFCRSNGMFWVVIIGFPILKEFLMNIYINFSFNVFKNTLIWGILTLIIIILPYILVLNNASNIYCADSYYKEKASWCNSIFPNIYSFIQDKHWNVSFFGYYNVNRIFMIYWGIHTFCILGYQLYSYILKNKESNSIYN